jgi:hypothetical protein
MKNMQNMQNIPFTILLVVLVFCCACQPVSIYTQRATATAYETGYMTSAMQAAESGALTLCNIDFESGQENYLEQICSTSTELGCVFFTNQVDQVWENLERSYSAEKLVCEKNTSRFLEEGNQFGLSVQYWVVNLRGTTGWQENSTDREYWLQVAEENSNWKLNRVLTSDEIAYYLAIDTMGAEE